MEFWRSVAGLNLRLFLSSSFEFRYTGYALHQSIKKSVLNKRTKNLCGEFY